MWRWLTKASTANFVAHKGKADSWMSAPLVSDITDDFIMRAWKWFDDLTHAQPRVIDIPLGAFVLIEIMQKVSIRYLILPVAIG